MIKGSYDYRKLSDFDQVCLCYIIKNGAIRTSLENAQFFEGPLWEVDESDCGLFKLTEKGCRFLDYAKRQEIMDTLYRKTPQFEYKKAFVAVLQEAKERNFDDNIERVLYYNDFTENEAFDQDVIYAVDGKIYVVAQLKYDTLDRMTFNVQKKMYSKTNEEKEDDIEK